MSTRMVRVVVAVFGILGSSIWCAAQPADPAPGGIRLLPGYRHHTGMGIDSHVGRLWKENGLSIGYDIGVLAGNYTEYEAKVKAVWFKEQVIGGRSVQLALTSDQMLYVTFPEVRANFFGRVQSEEDVTDMLLMVLTYAPTEKLK